MSRSWGRAQVEPLAALVALFAVCGAVSVYAGTLDARLGTHDHPPVEEALDRTRERLWNDTAADSGRLVAVSPDGYRLNATLTAGERRWTAGQAPPADAARASEPVAVRLGPARVAAGRLRVVVW